MIGHRGRFRENDDLPLWQGPVVKKKPPFSSELRTVGMCNAILGNDLKVVGNSFQYFPRLTL